MDRGSQVWEGEDRLFLGFPSPAPSLLNGQSLEANRYFFTRKVWFRLKTFPCSRILRARPWKRERGWSIVDNNDRTSRRSFRAKRKRKPRPWKKPFVCCRSSRLDSRRDRFTPIERFVRDPYFRANVHGPWQSTVKSVTIAPGGLSASLVHDVRFQPLVATEYCWRVYRLRLDHVDVYRARKSQRKIVLFATESAIERRF